MRFICSYAWPPSSDLAAVCCVAAPCEPTPDQPLTRLKSISHSRKRHDTLVFQRTGERFAVLLVSPASEISAMISFSDYIQKQAMSPAELPLVHTTEYFNLASIRASHTLQASNCNIFKEPLLYFFYGRPAYRDSSQTSPTRDVGFYPICFVFQPDTVCKKVKRLYPFDTGASQHGLYEPAIKRAEALTDYQVPAAV